MPLRMDIKVGEVGHSCTTEGAIAVTVCAWSVGLLCVAVWRLAVRTLLLMSLCSRAAEAFRAFGPRQVRGHAPEGAVDAGQLVQRQRPRLEPRNAS